MIIRLFSGASKVYAFLMLAILLATAQAQAETRSFDVPAQPLADSLHAVATRAHVNMVFDPPMVAGRMAPAVKAASSAADALSQILIGTGLTFEFLNEKTVVVSAGKPTVRQIGEEVRSAGVWDRFRVAEEGEKASAGENGKTEEGVKLEEVVVTAQKRKERLRDVPISMSVLDGAQLDSSSDRGVAEALNRVPGVTNLALQFGERFGGHTSVAIRGVTAATATGGTTGYYLDSIPFGFVTSSYAPDSNAYDLERVEVLRGPQGTLYGASSLNGVVRVLTRNADLHGFDFKARTSVAGTENGSETYRGDMAVNVPLVEGKLVARAVIGYQDIGGWIDKPNQKDANDRQVGNVRLKINAQPTEQLSLGLFAWQSRTDIGAPTQSADDLHSPSVVKEKASIDYDAYGFTLGYDFGQFSLSSATSYIDFTNGSTVDLDVFGPGVGTIASEFDSRVFSQEIYFSSTGESPWRWTLGGAYRDAAEKAWQLRSVGYVAPSELKTVSKSFAAFGELTRSFMDSRLELTGGLRYFKDNLRDKEVSRQNCVNGLPPDCAGDIPPGLTDYPPLQSPHANFDHTSPRAVLTWHVSKQTDVYTSYAEGFRSGLNQSPEIHAVAPEYPPAKPDKLKNYEIGAKGSFWDGRVNYDAAAFYMDWKDVQQSVFVIIVPGTNITDSAVLNATSASGPGFEFGVTVAPLKGFSVNANLSWNDLRVDKAIVDSSGSNVIKQHERLLGSAETTAGVSVDYAFPLGSSGWEGQFSTSANYLSNLLQSRTIASDGTVVAVVRGSTMESRASFGVVSPNHWTTTLFVDNLGNERGYAPDPFTPYWSTWSRPRTMGLQVEYKFH